MTSSSALRSRSDVTGAARALQPVLRKFAEFGDTHRRSADEVIEALQDAGMFRLFTPRRFGGLATDLVTLLEVTTALGEADGSAAWLVGVAASTSWLVAHGSPELQEEVLGAEPDARIAGGAAGAGTARATTGGRLVSGRWAYASGAPHASWAAVMATLTGEGGSPPAPVFALMPMAEVHVADTWHTSGLRGTGSNTVVADDVFVPAHRLITMDALSNQAQSGIDPLYRLPFQSVGECSLIGPMLGVGCAALAFVVESATHKQIAHTAAGGTQGESVGVQLQIADAALRLQTAQLHTWSVAETATSHVDSPPDPAALARSHAQSCHAMHEISSAVNILVDVHGSGGFAEASPLRRIAGDVAIGTRHAAYNATVGNEQFGKALLGVTG
jgi:3-hydroxy-9,10-secoandrosta-1,3,5(10)-triene-9,17-dione monooxygenase